MPDSVIRSERLIAQDLVDVLQQVDRLSVEFTVLHLPPSEFGKDNLSIALKSALEGAGYAIRTAGVVAGEKAVNFSEQRKTDSKYGLIRTITVSIGDVSVRRSYAQREGEEIQPVAVMQVRGVDASSLQLKDDLFSLPSIVTSKERKVDEPAPTYKVAEANRGKLSVVQNDPSGNSPKQSKLLDIVAPGMVSRTSSKPEKFGSIRRLSDAPTKNFRELGESNFADVFDDFAMVDEIILTFENDSVRLGVTNKTAVRRFVKKFNPANDVLSVIGCSNGPTSLAMGQEGLALGRAERVKEELLYAGVPSESILDEGCWAEKTFDERMPKRGVVLTLKRRAN